MAGSFDFTPESGQLADLPCQIGVYRYDPTQDPPNCYTFLPNVRCEQIQFKEGPEPATAQFSYILDDSIADQSEEDPEDQDETYPSQFEELWPLESPTSPYKVVAGDRLVVLETSPQGNYQVLWDGFSQIPQADISGRTQHNHFVGTSVAVRLWDDVIGGRVQRGASTPTTPGNMVETDLPTRFNPADDANAAGLPNCTPDGTDETTGGVSDNEFPIFLEPHLPSPDGDPADIYQTFWTLGKAARYLLGLGNTFRDPAFSLYVLNPDFSVLDALLENYQPTGDFYDPSDPSTFTTNPILVRDYDATDKVLPEILWDLLAPYGFRYRFVTEGESHAVGQVIIETPTTYLEIYRVDNGGPTDPKQLQLPVARTTLDPATSNLGDLAAVQDSNGVANRWEIETEPIRYEVSVLLAPGFQPVAGDELASGNRKKFLLSNLDNADLDTRQKYRLWIANECGQDSFWDLVQREWITPEDDGPKPAVKFSDVFAPGDSQEDEDNPDDPNYVARYRPGANRLFSLDPSGKPRAARLEVSRSYEPEVQVALIPPCLYQRDDTGFENGNWQTITGGWRLLRDRLGIYVTIEDPEAWDIGKPGPDEADSHGHFEEPSGVLHGITCLSNPASIITGAPSQQPFFLRLTTVIEGDHCLDAVAEIRPACPFPFTITRRIDARDQFKKEIIAECSAFNPTAGFADQGEVVSRDDSKLALAYAYQYRAAHEFPPCAGSVNIPWFTKSYQVSDRIDEISGRDANLRTNAGAEQGEGPFFPYVVGVTWDFRGDAQRTILQLTDRRNEPHL